jgi:sigma-B regulation protein RsbU (phosphoserine phosphatase)
MAKAANNPIKKQLVDRRSRLENALADLPNDPQVQRLLDEVDDALERVDRGTYGVCDTCQGLIEPERLIVDPLVRVCLDCLTPAQQRALEEDLELATKIQTALLPQQHLQLPGWEAAYRYERAGPVSGDYCDLVISGENLYFIVGDVSGKGVAASMLMAHLHATFRSLMSIRLSIDEIMGRANRMFCESTLPTHYATLVCGKTTCGGEIEVCNAGHNPPLLVQGSDIIELKATGLPMGMFCDGRYSVNRVQLSPGDTLFLYTDGLSEAMNSTGQEYGPGRLCGILNKNGLLAPKDIIAACMEDLSVFQSGLPRTDDLTVLVIRRLEEED